MRALFLITFFMLDFANAAVAENCTRSLDDVSNPSVANEEVLKVSANLDGICR